MHFTHINKKKTLYITLHCIFVVGYMNINSVKPACTVWCQILYPAQGLSDYFWQQNNKEERSTTTKVLLRLEAWGDEARPVFSLSSWTVHTNVSFVYTNKQQIWVYMLMIKRTPNRYDVKPFILQSIPEFCSFEYIQSKLTGFSKKAQISPLYSTKYTVCHATICCCHPAL